MFPFLFGRWRKASTCKKVLQQLQSSLKLLKNKKYAVSRHLRRDIALSIRINDPTRAVLRTEQLSLVEISISIYDLLLQFSDLILLHFSSIRKHRELVDDDINEAVSSLVFASTSCGGDIPELITTKDLFGQRYGQKYVTTALQLLPGNLVNFQIKEKVSISSVPEELKSKLVDEIAKESGLRFEMLMLEYTPEIEKQVIEEEEKKVIDSDSNSLYDDYSPEVCKFSLTDMEEEKCKEETSMEDDFIEEVQVGRNQRVFRFRESSSEEDRPSSSSSSSSSSVSLSRGFKDMEMKREEEGEEERRRRLPKHVHPKLPDYDQIVSQFKAIRSQHRMHS
ncbi:hypothetical protein AALP_AA6G184100 [Arabis alpina]|uniref:Ist1p n=1 Tax=Arabis alpina TaxID=50452 RepID=A0A087GQ23_ARAAL|nr:hypothetical protein AALP_AA6G184100 [Arabis alpina]